MNAVINSVTTKLREISERWQTATPGPWEWHGNERNQDVYLVAIAHNPDDGLWRPFVMKFQRWGMQMAQPVFRVEPAMRGVAQAGLLATDHNGWIWSINHPDAIAIAAAPSDVAYLLKQINVYREELERLAAAEPAHRTRIRALLDGEST